MKRCEFVTLLIALHESAFGTKRPANRRDVSLLLGAKRTFLQLVSMSAIEPRAEVRHLVLVWVHKTAALQQTMRHSAGSPKVRGKAMAQIYRDVAIDQMIATTEEAMSHAIDWWGDLPTSMKEALDTFRVQLSIPSNL